MGVIELASPVSQYHRNAEFAAPAQSRIAARFKPASHTLDVAMKPSPIGGNQYFSLDILNDLETLIQGLQGNGMRWISGGTMQPVHYLVLKSTHPDYFSLGGDLAHFRDCIQRRDQTTLRNYSMMCLDMIYELSERTSRQATTIALVQGRALGGGFETALTADFIIAEEHSEFGFPEILFGLFPCTGGMSLLARRIGVYEAGRMMSNGKIYGARELKDMGIVDEICPRGQGEIAVEKFIADHARHRAARLMLQRARHRMAPLNYEELKTVVDDWVETAMNLPKEELRVMEMLIQMQRGLAAA